MATGSPYQTVVSDSVMIGEILVAAIVDISESWMVIDAARAVAGTVVPAMHAASIRLSIRLEKGLILFHVPFLCELLGVSEEPNFLAISPIFFFYCIVYRPKLQGGAEKKSQNRIGAILARDWS